MMESSSMRTRTLLLGAAMTVAAVAFTAPVM